MRPIRLTSFGYLHLPTGPDGRPVPPAADRVEDVRARLRDPAAARERFEEMAATALRERSSYKDFLADLLEAECAHREERKKLRLVREANFPRPKRLEDFDFAANPNITPEQINTLADPSWVTAGQPLCLIGDSGTGKSHLLIGLGTAVAEAGLKVRYTTTANLVNELAEAADEKKLGRTLARYSRVDLLCLDEFGYLDLDKTGAKLLFQVFTEREEQRAIAIASNVPFSERKQTFTDPRLCAAIVDRVSRSTPTSSKPVSTPTDSRRPRRSDAEPDTPTGTGPGHPRPRPRVRAGRECPPSGGRNQRPPQAHYRSSSPRTRPAATRAAPTSASHQPVQPPSRQAGAR
jgi:DNA replication protein DnaC